MAMAPWVILSVAAIGFLGSIFGALVALGGVILTQRRSDRRDEAAWAREREREYARWSREDAARTFELKREAYTAYFDTVGRYRDELGTDIDNDRTPTREQYRELEEELGIARTKVDIYGSPKIKHLAHRLEKLIIEILKGRVRREDDLHARVVKIVALSYVRSNILEAMRMDLGIIPANLTPLERDEDAGDDDDENDYWDWDDEDGRSPAEDLTADMSMTHERDRPLGSTVDE